MVGSRAKTEINEREPRLPLELHQLPPSVYTGLKITIHLSTLFLLIVLMSLITCFGQKHSSSANIRFLVPARMT